MKLLIKETVLFLSSSGKIFRIVKIFCGNKIFHYSYIFTERNQVINKETESVEISMICHPPGNTSDTEDGNKYDVLNSEWPTEIRGIWTS